MARDYLGKYAHLRGKTIRREVAAAKPAGKGIAGKGMPNTCNYRISDKEFERELREYQAAQAAEKSAPEVVENAEVEASEAVSSEPAA